ncbi:MAG: chromosomal replication initiator protein DnaA [Planctomycetales bacterium]
MNPPGSGVETELLRAWGGKMQPGTLAMVQPVSSTETQVLRELVKTIGQKRYDHWFGSQASLRVRDRELIVEVTNPFLMTWLQKQFREELADVARRTLGETAGLRFEVVAGEKSSPAPSSSARDVPIARVPDGPLRASSVDDGSDPESSAALEAPAKTFAAVVASVAKSSDVPKPQRGRRAYLLAEFVEGNCNKIALTAVRQVSQHPGQTFNPLFLYGPVGTGKTHLLEGTVVELRSRFPGLQVVSMTAENFANHFTQGLRQHALPAFRQKFRNADVLVIEGIEFLDSKKGIQEEFLHTFKHLEANGKQVILSSDRHPRLLSRVSEELKTRFLSGMVCRLEAPDVETRQQIVRQRAERLGGEFSPEALNFVAQRFRNNVRELEGALHSLQNYYCMTGKRVSLHAAQKLLSDLERDCLRVVKLSEIEQAVCDLFGLMSEELRSDKRTRTVSQPRMIAMFLARKHTRSAYSEIGAYFGGRNHSTVITAERKIDAWLKTHSSVRVAAQNWPVEDVLEALEQQLLQAC